MNSLSKITPTGAFNKYFMANQDSPAETISWPKASEGDQCRLRIIKKACRHMPHLVDWMFLKDKPEMFAGPEEVLNRAACFSSGEKVLVRFSLDVWSSSGNVEAMDIWQLLDPRNFAAVMDAIIEVRQL